MTPSQLKQNYLEHHPESYFFTRKTMKFFGDTMRNFGVSEDMVTINGSEVKVWCLYRKRPVKHGLQRPFFFSRDTYTLLHNVRPD